jgi:hypothetical protein
MNSVELKLMLIGLVGFGSSPPAPPSSDDEPSRDGGADDTSIRVPSTGGVVHSRYGRRTSKAGRYAWAISLGIHALVLTGAFLGMRFYFRPLAAPRLSSDDTGQDSFGPIVQGADAGALIRGGTGLSFVAADSAADSKVLNDGNLPSFVRRQPQTTLTLHDLSPVSGVEGLGGAAGAGGLPRRLATRTIAP